MRKGLGCLSPFALLTAAITLFILVGVVYAGGGTIFNPGPLNAQSRGEAIGGVTSHAAIGGKCESCHAAPWDWKGMDERCMNCHQDVRLQRTDPSSLHGVLFKSNPAQNCRACHKEHRGADAPLTTVSLATFPHEDVGFSLKAHQSKSDGTAFICSDCHAQNRFTTPFDVSTCVNCHSQSDQAFMLQHALDFGLDCMACHDGRDRFSRQTFDHNQFAFPLQGKHAPLRCAACHAQARSLADLQATPQDCVACHQKDDPHQGRFGNDCASCHTPDGWKPAKFDHNLARFKLTGKHQQVACENCHQNGRYQGTPMDCASCHRQDDPHQGELPQCETCHTPDGWKPATIDHSTFAFPLTGAHVNVACQSCHQTLAFKSTPTECFACHQKDDPHQGRFGKECSLCHSTSAWKPATFDHNLAAFKLTGAHVNVACEQCHVNGIFRGTPQDCYSCHKNNEPHQGRFGTNCAACHSTSAWKPATFDHNLSGFPLTGAHARLACERCHSGGNFTTLPTACVACHGEPTFHAGALGTNCAACHSTNAWRPATFNLSHPQPRTDEGGSGIRHGGASCRTCHPSTVRTYTCLACHNNNGGGDGGEGGGGGDDG